MIKMFIGNEEVVSKNEFTIDEEMLSASSTILNNCYPKSWELTKDYASNFYYPKDYSKFILGEGEFLHGDTEYSVLETANASYETNIEKEWNSLEVYGNTYQETEPETYGKNLLCFGNVLNSLGLTIVKQNNSQIAINGTVQANGSVVIALDYPPSLSTGTYVLSVIVPSGHSTSGFTLELPQSNNFHSISMGTGAGSRTTGSQNENGRTYNYVNLNVTKNMIFTNYVIELQLEKNSTATSFEPFYVVAGKPSPTKPSELVSVGYENLIKIKDNLATSTIGLTYTYNEQDNVVNIKGTPTRSYETFILNREVNLEAGNYIFFIDKALPFRVVLYHTFEDDTTDTITMTPGMTSVIRNFAKKVISFRIGTTVMTTGTAIDETFKIQFEKGTQQHSYIPYGKYGIEVKNAGKNLLPVLDGSLSYNGLTITIKNGIVNIDGTSSGTTYIKFTNGLEGASSLNNSWFNELCVNNKNNKTFCMNYISGSGPTSGCAIRVFAETSTYLNQYYLYQSLQTTTYTQSGKISSVILYTQGNKTFNNYKFSLQIENGNQPTSFEQYKENSQLYVLDNPLRAIGNVKDRLYIENSYLYVERKIGSVVLNGSESWNSYDMGTFLRCSTNEADEFIKEFSYGNVMSNYFKGSDDFGVIDTVRITGGSYMIGFALSLNDFANKDAFTTWLSTHNTEVQYILKTPVIEEIGKVGINNSYDGKNNISLETGITTTYNIYYYWKNFNILFAGIVKNSGDISLNPRYPHYCSLQILDYKTFLSESDTLDFVISNKTIKEAIEMVVSAVADYGFIVGNIDIESANDIIGAYSTLNKTAYDVLQYLANISGSRWRARYVDSSSMAIDFFDPDTLPQASDIEYTKEYWEDNNIVDLTFNYGTRDYRNKQIILSNEVYGSIDYTDVLLSNGYDTSFITQQNVGIVKSVTVNGVEKDVISQKEKELGADADFYYTPGKNIVDSATSYTAGTQIAITYTPLVKGRQIVYNDEEVTRIATQTDTVGIISRYESRNDIVSSQELEEIGKTYIEYKGKAEIILTLTTQNKNLYDIGEVVYFNAPIDELRQKYMVKSKKTEYAVINEVINLFYVYELTSSFNSEKAVNYFDNQRNKAQGNIQEGESITRNIDINTSAVIVWGNSTITETSVSVDGDNALNSVLNSPFIV